MKYFENLIHTGSDECAGNVNRDSIPHVEPDNCGNYVEMQTTAEDITKDLYKVRWNTEIKTESGGIIE